MLLTSAVSAGSPTPDFYRREAERRVARAGSSRSAETGREFLHIAREGDARRAGSPAYQTRSMTRHFQSMANRGGSVAGVQPSSAWVWLTLVLASGAFWYAVGLAIHGLLH
jgi:hypothetical protein